MHNMKPKELVSRHQELSGWGWGRAHEDHFNNLSPIHVSRADAGSETWGLQDMCFSCFGLHLLGYGIG